MKLTALLPALALSATAVSAFDKIIAYADSFTDNGNDYRASKFPPVSTSCTTTTDFYML